MKTTKILSAMIVLALAAGTMTGCRKGEAKHKDTRTNTSYLYQYTANCSGGDTVSGHSNKVVLTDATGQPAVVSLSDLYVEPYSDGDAYKVYTLSGATWQGAPKKGGTTTITKLAITDGGFINAYLQSGTIYWESLDLDGDNKYEGKATFTCN